MASHQVETALLLVAIVVLFVVGAAVLAFVGACRLALDLQERVSVRGTPIVARVKFGKCRHK